MYDEQKVDDVVLALMHLTSWQDHGATRAWKGFDWDALDRLHRQGMISDPKSKAKSVALSPEGAERSRALFERFFRGSGEDIPPDTG